MAAAIAAPIVAHVATTIQIDETTLEELRKLKATLHVATYDEVVRRLLVTHRKRTTKLLGVTPYLGPFERDHHDRD